MYTIAVSELSNGKYTPSGAFNAGTYTISATYSGDDSIMGAVATPSIFTISKVNPTIMIALDNITVGATLTITPTTSGSGNIKIIINGKTYTVDNNTAQTIDELAAGTYDVVAIYDGDENHTAAFNTTKVTVKLIPITVTVSANATVPVGANTTIKVTSNQSDVSGSVIVTVGNVD